MQASWPGRRLAWILAGSLAVNLVLLGVVLGTQLRPFGPQFGPHFGPPPPPRDAAAFVERLADTLPEADARIVRDSYASHAHELESRELAVSDARTEVARLLTRERVSAPELQAAFTAMRAASGAMEEEIQTIMLEILPKLSLPAREKLERMSHGPPH